MTDEAAQSREAAGSSQDAPAPSAVPPPPPAAAEAAPPPAYEPPAANLPPTPDPPPPPPGPTPPPGATPPPGSMPPGAAPPPWFGAADSGPTFVREKLIRPTRGRYVAGVAGAIGNATNTDPVLWRVVLAVLGFFGGVGVLIYLVGWLLIPAEGDTASPIESLLGRGRSATAPLSIVLLGAAAVMTFAFVVRDGFRATLLAAAVLVCGGLLVRRGTRNGASGATPSSASAPGATPGPAPANAGAAWSAAPPAAPDAATFPQPAATAPAAPAPHRPGATPFPAATAPAGEPMTAPLPPTPPNYTQGAYVPPSTSYAPPRPPEFGPPTGGYRPPFAPHGPWAQGGNRPSPPPAPPHPPRPPKRRRERSKLGRITFFMVVMVMGVLALIDLSGAQLMVSAYFAAALVTIALGLIVGAWFGRARGLIALALLASLGLGISSGAENWGGELGNSSYRPQSITAVADRYDFTIGAATLDLRAVDFTGKEQVTTVAMRVGQIKILLPDNVDTTTMVRMDGGRARVFGREWDGKELGSQEITDLGPDGAGGGSLRLTIELNTGDLEVTR